MVEHSKIEAVVKYLAGKFCGYTIEHKYDQSLGAEAFRIRHSHSYYVKITEDYLNHSSCSQILADMQQWRTDEYIRDKGSKIIFINENGPHLLEYVRTIGEIDL